MKTLSFDACSVLVPLPETHRTASGVVEASPPGWIEEPVAGANWWGPLDFRHAFNAGAREHVMPTPRWLEHVDWWNPILKSPLKLRAGLADTAGVLASGVEFDDDALRKYTA